MKTILFLFIVILCSCQKEYKQNNTEQEHKYESIVNIQDIFSDTITIEYIDYSTSYVGTLQQEEVSSGLDNPFIYQKE